MPSCQIPPATSCDKEMIDEVTSVDAMASGGCKQIFDAGNGRVLIQCPGDSLGHEYVGKHDLMVTQMCSGMSTLIPNFPRLCSSPVHDERCVTPNIIERQDALHDF